MKTIGLLGGMSWESTISYYQALNEGIKAQLGGLHSAKICLHSVNFAEIETLQKLGEWQKAAELLSAAAQSVERAGADFLLICTNTMHKVEPQIANNISIPILHIADATAQALVRDGITKVALLGTRFTMEQNFYKARIMDNFPIEVIVPKIEQQNVVHEVIYEELCQGIINPASKAAYLTIIDSLYSQGAQAVILGCTEIALLVKQIDTQVPMYDTAKIHADAAIEWALREQLL